MFQVSVGEPYDVKVRFENHPFILDKLRRLCSARTETADIEVSGSEIVYSDRIRGLEAFSRYLRRFGSSCIVECPDELRHMAERSAERLIERYAAEGGDL